MRLVFPPALCLILSSLVYRVFLLLFSYANTPAMFAGGLFGYICYDMMHYYLHHGTPVSHYLKSMKKYHVDHHYKNVHEGYGITSKLWDYAFFTMPADKTTQIGFVSAIQKEE
jgi:sterol desaturase/sphingolipid hydroxylase (fatty acid hydroxylase superfamily)